MLKHVANVYDVQDNSRISACLCGLNLCIEVCALKLCGAHVCGLNACGIN